MVRQSSYVLSDNCYNSDMLTAQYALAYDIVVRNQLQVCSN